MYWNIDAFNFGLKLMHYCRLTMFIMPSNKVNTVKLLSGRSELQSMNVKCKSVIHVSKTFICFQMMFERKRAQSQFRGWGWEFEHSQMVFPQVRHTHPYYSCSGLVCYTVPTLGKCYPIKPIHLSWAPWKDGGTPSKGRSILCYRKWMSCIFKLTFKMDFSVVCFDNYQFIECDILQSNIFW